MNIKLVSCLTAFGLAAGIIIADNITVERQITGTVTDWSQTSCQLSSYDTICLDGQDMKDYTGFDNGVVLDVSHALPQGENFDNLVDKAFAIEHATGTAPRLTATYTQSLLDFVQNPFSKSINAHYASQIRIVP